MSSCAPDLFDYLRDRRLEQKPGDPDQAQFDQFIAFCRAEMTANPPVQVSYATDPTGAITLILQDGRPIMVHRQTPGEMQSSSYVSFLGRDYGPQQAPGQSGLFGR